MCDVDDLARVELDRGATDTTDDSAAAPFGNDLVAQCEAWGLVYRQSDPLDARARRVCFTPVGLAWLQAFREAVEQAESEFRAAVGDDVATVVALGLEAYAA